MKKIVVGNWKMNLGPPLDQVKEFAKFINTSISGDTETVLSPSTPFLSAVSAATAGTNVSISAQDCSIQPVGPYTGDANAEIIKAAGATYVIVGHSERRALHHETNEDVRKKAAAAMAAGLIPIVCVGESEAERQSGRAEEVVEKEVMESLPDAAAKSQFILAYEPVWAIGSGLTPTMDDIARMHAYIASVAAKRTGLAPARISVLYGGSVKADNAGAIMATQGVAGVLVGGASLKLDEFRRIIEAAEKKG